MPWSNLLAFAIVALVLIAVPGPSVLFVIGRSLSSGRRGGLLSVLGNALGEAVHVLAVALGLGVLVAESATLFTVVKLAGAAYLVLLGVQTIRKRHAAPGSAPAPPHRMLRQGFLVGVSNPKSVVFLAAVLPQFVVREQGSVPLQLAELGLVFLLLAVLSDSTWALAAGSARGWFGGSPRRLRRLDATGGALMIGLGGVLATASRS